MIALYHENSLNIKKHLHCINTDMCLCSVREESG